MTINEFIKQFNKLDMPYGETHYKMSATKEESFAILWLPLVQDPTSGISTIHLFAGKN